MYTQESSSEKWGLRKHAIVDAVAAEVSDKNIGSSPYGLLFELAVAHDYHGYGTFATVYDDVVVAKLLRRLERIEKPFGYCSQIGAIMERLELNIQIHGPSI